MFSPHTLEKNNTESRVGECTNCISANLSNFHQNVTFCHQFPFCLQCTSEAIKNWLILCCVLFSSVFPLCFKLWQFKVMVNEKKVLNLRYGEKCLLQEVDKSTTATRMRVTVWAGCGMQPKLWFWSHCQGSGCRMLWRIRRARVVAGMLTVVAREMKFQGNTGCLGVYYWTLKNN